MTKGTLIEKTTYDLGLALQANLPKSRIPLKVQEYFLQHKELLSTILQRGFFQTLPADFLGHRSGFSIADWEKLLQEESDPASSILRLISSGQKITIRATSGERTIAQAKDVFTWGIDSDFTNWGQNVLDCNMPETPAEVYEMVKDANFKTIFDSLGRSLDELCFTQEQVIAFVEDHKNWLRKDSHATFFLMKKGNEFFVAGVHLDFGERPFVFVIRFLDNDVWYGDNRHRVVVPQLTLVV